MEHSSKIKLFINSRRHFTNLHNADFGPHPLLLLGREIMPSDRNKDRISQLPGEGSRQPGLGGSERGYGP